MKLTRWGVIVAIISLAGCVPGDLEVPTQDLMPAGSQVVAGADAIPIQLELEKFQILDSYVVSNATCPLHTFHPKLANSSLDAMRRAFAARYRLVDRASEARASVVITLKDIGGSMTCRRGLPYRCDGSFRLEYFLEVNSGEDGLDDGVKVASSSAERGTEHVFCSAIRIEFEKHYESAFKNLINITLARTEKALGN